MKKRLDQTLVTLGLVPTRSQAESYIRLGKVKVNGRDVTKTGYMVGEHDDVLLGVAQQYVSRAGLKLESVAAQLQLVFKGKVVLDVGSSTGGFTDFALQKGAKKVIAVDVGTNQLHPSLRADPRIELHEQTDIRNVKKLSAKPDIIVMDVSFISLRDILPYVAKLSSKQTQIVAMLKPQFEIGSGFRHKGVVKNEAMRRQILKDFEQWAKQGFVLKDKSDSQVAGEKGNRERFYLLQIT